MILDPPPQPSKTEHADPAEVDISEHYYPPKTTNRIPSQGLDASSPPTINDDALRELMLGMDPASMRGNGTPPVGPGANPFAGFPGMEGLGGQPGEEDPMMKLFQQMMGGGIPGMDGAGAGGMPAFPGMPGQEMPGSAAAVDVDPYAYLWRIVHAFLALSFGLYIALTTPFTGTKFERESRAFRVKIAEDGTSTLSSSSIHFFYIFATAEVLLQSSRFWFEKGRGIGQGGILGTIQGFLPEPWRGYLSIARRYMRIWTTVSADAMVLVFVLGVCAWVRGGGVA